MTGAATTNETSKTNDTKTHHRTDKSKTSGFKSVPTRSLVAQLHLLQLILEGMQKHAKDPDYPTALDGLGVPAAYSNSTAKALAESSTKIAARKATGEAVAERTVNGVFLEKIQDILLTAYGRRSETLRDYGFRPVEKRVRRKSRKAGAAGAPAAAGSGTSASTGTATPPGGPTGGAPGGTAG